MLLTVLVEYNALTRIYEEEEKNEFHVLEPKQLCLEGRSNKYLFPHMKSSAKRFFAYQREIILSNSSPQEGNDAQLSRSAVFSKVCV